MQQVYDNLYEKSRRGEKFSDLMSIILSRENILLAYRNIKTNTGSKTAGTDKLTIEDIGKLTPGEVVEKVRFITTGSVHGYRPKPVRRKDIPKPYDPTKSRPLGIPCIWDRLVQQAVRQVMEPICEARFSENSFGFRPNRSAENAIAAAEKLMQVSHMQYVIEVDIKGFFDNVNHSKLIKQIWAMGIQDTTLIYIIKQMLKAPIKMPNGTMIKPDKGTPQGGILSPLLANIVLNELDQWVDSQWRKNPKVVKYGYIAKDGHFNCGNGYRAMRKTKLKEMYIIRYADDFRIFCSNKTDADKTLIATMKWLKERLRLEVSEEKTRVVNLKRKYTKFLGFKTKLRSKNHKDVIKSHIDDKQLSQAKLKLVQQAKNIASPRSGKTIYEEILLYNSMVMGIQNYYKLATEISGDAHELQRAVMTTLTNRMGSETGIRLRKTGRKLTAEERARYGKSAMMRYVAGTDEPIYPIGYVQHRNPMNKKRLVCNYTPEGRKEIHQNLGINVSLMHKLMRQSVYDRSIEYADNRISLFSAQWGKCAITGKVFETTEDIHCHHKIPKEKGGSDKYENLILILKPVHKLIHATDEETVHNYVKILGIDETQKEKINGLRKMAGLSAIK